MKQTKKKSKRSYNNKSRHEKQLLDKQQIIGVYIDMLVSAKGKEVSLQELAEKSGKSLRTIFRFFGDKNSLNKELEQYLLQYLNNTIMNSQKMPFVEFAVFSFLTLDKYENLVKAYLNTGFGLKARQIFRQQYNDLLEKKLKDELKEKYDLKKIEPMRIKFITSIINASIWQDLKETQKFNSKQIEESVRWAIQSLIKELI
ncbi:MAG: hypothetical protein ACXVAX_13450 [Pseudobdellovibrio sp.]